MGSRTNPMTCAKCESPLTATYTYARDGVETHVHWWCPLCDATPTPPAPADDATRHESASAEAMREAFVAWQMEWAPKGDECERARIEWDKIGTPLARLVNGDIVCLENEWEAWQAARALPLPPATGDATRVPARREEARDAVVEAAKFAGYEVERAHFDAWWADKSDGWRRASCKGADLSGVAWDAYYERALWGTRPEGHSPASGQGGDK